MRQDRRLSIVDVSWWESRGNDRRSRSHAGEGRKACDADREGTVRAAGDPPSCWRSDHPRAGKDPRVSEPSLEPFRFCPLCATELVAPRRPGGGAYCPAHERSWYRNSAPAVGCALIREEQALVTLRGREPEKGRLDVPGGFLEPGEHPVDGIRREAYEELGVTIANIEGPLTMATHRYGEEGDCVLALGFTARIAEGEPAPADDAADLLWVSLEALEGLDFAWEHDRTLVRTALEASPDVRKERERS